MITALTAFILPMIAAALIVFTFAYWLILWARSKESARSFVLDFIPFTSDVRAAELALPEMRRAA